MNIEETFTLDAPVAQVYEFLSDVQRVAACVPGVGDVTQRDDDVYEATLQIQMGPIRAAFAGEVTLTTTEDPYRIEAAGRGRDRKSGSRAEVAFSGGLEPTGDTATLVTTSADVTIRGRLGQFGTGVIRATATEVIRDFVSCANDVLRAEPVVPSESAAPDATAGTDRRQPARRTGRSPGQPQARVTVGLVVRILLGFVRNVLQSVADRLRKIGR